MTWSSRDNDYLGYPGVGDQQTLLVHQGVQINTDPVARIQCSVQQSLRLANAGGHTRTKTRTHLDVAAGGVEFDPFDGARPSLVVPGLDDTIDPWVC